MMNKDKILVFLLFLTLGFTVSLSTASAVNIYDASSYNITNLSLNQQIQNSIDNAKSGDTINFLGKNYKNLTLVINKKLNIVSNVDTTIENSRMNNYLNTVFYINSSASGTIISGFTIINNNGFGIIVNNTKNIVINNNIISSKESGLFIDKSSNINITKNVLKNSLNGVFISNSNDVLLKNNVITSNKNNGIYLKDNKNFLIESNYIYNNNDSGIYLDDSNMIQIKNNNITYNKNSGIVTKNSAEDLIITGNILLNNYYGINLDSTKNNGLIIKSNTAHFNHDGIRFSENYKDVDRKDISSNVLHLNYGKEVELIDSPYENIAIGANWYGASSYGFINICHKLQTSLIQAKLIKGSNGIYYLGLFDGDKLATDLPSLSAVFLLNNQSKVTTQTENGVAMVNYTGKILESKDNEIIASVGSEKIVNLLSADNFEENPLDSNGKGGGGSGGGSGSGGDGGFGVSKSGDGNNGNTQGNDGNSGVNGEILDYGSPSASSSTGSDGATSSPQKTDSQQQGKEILIQDTHSFEMTYSDYLVYIVVAIVIGVISVGYIVKPS
jgi:parallel beta-helix repeat protein